MDFLKSRADFVNELRNAPVGAAVTYHIGNLISDREVGKNFMSVHSTARAAWDAMEKGEVHLLQRHTPHGCVYLAIKRPQPHKKIKWLGCYNPNRFLFHKRNTMELSHAA